MRVKRVGEKVASQLYIAWFTGIAATFASIYFIEVRGNSAAALCWFERMLMFGVVLVLTTGIIRRDLRMKYYVYAFLLFGIPSAVYQQLVHWNFITTSIQSCSVSVVCSTKFFELFGVITQATLCLGAFIIILICMQKIKDPDVKNP